MSCYTGYFHVRRGWESLNTGPRFYLCLIQRTGWLLIYTSRTTDGYPFKPKKLSVPFLYPGVPTGLAPFRGLVPLGWRNLVPILPRHTLWFWYSHKSLAKCHWVQQYPLCLSPRHNFIPTWSPRELYLHIWLPLFLFGRLIIFAPFLIIN
jgi:hypothetical protein